MDKQFIISEIQRTAASGKALGQIRFTSETGIKRHEWLGKYWARWGDALAEAGFAQNEWTAAHGEMYVMESLLGLARNLQKFPTKYDILSARNIDPQMPSYKAVSHLGTRTELREKLLKFCSTDPRHIELIPLISSIPTKQKSPLIPVEEDPKTSGYVYLVRAQTAYKIGSTRAPYRRVSEIANQSATGAELLHLISTDDPEGIENYWHRRFEEKRIMGLNKQSGEWFNLSADEVKAFRRRKTM
jgi:hypothetical protein